MHLIPLVALNSVLFYSQDKNIVQEFGIRDMYVTLKVPTVACKVVRAVIWEGEIMYEVFTIAGSGLQLLTVILI